MAETVVGGTLLGIGEDAVGLGGLAEFFLGLLLVRGIAVGMPLERGLAVTGLGLLDGGRAGEGEDFVVVAFVGARHGQRT